MESNPRQGLLRNLRSRAQDSEHPNGNRNCCRDELRGDLSRREHCLLVRSFKENEKVLVEIALGFVQTNKDCIRYVMDLQRSLYGLAQSPRYWWKTTDPKLIELGFVPLKSDSCTYVYQRNGTTAIITRYVDDLLIIGCDITVVNGTKKNLMEKFKLSDFGDVSLILGIQVSRNRAKGSLTISLKVLDRIYSQAVQNWQLQAAEHSRLRLKTANGATGDDSSRQGGNSKVPRHPGFRSVPAPSYTLRRHVRVQPACEGLVQASKG